MQKLLVIVVIVLFVLGGVFLQKSKSNSNSSTSQKIVSEEKTKDSLRETYLFVPYWTIDENIKESNQKLIYFGITGGENGIDTTEPGFKNLESFSANKNDKESFLTVRMLDTDTNLDILKNKNTQKEIIEKSIDIARNYNFSGIILDLETQGLPFDMLLKNITYFNASFAKSARENNLSFGTLLFGDTFYRVRPYDVEEIGKVVDRLYVMAYDFSKVKGSPGPNFPFDAKNEYGYDFETMIQDFSKVVPKEKLTFILGMFGYDWRTDGSGKSIGTASSKTTLQMERMLNRCITDNSCSALNSNSGMKVSYKADGEDHKIWFETYDSSEKKKQYLKEQGLNSIGYWAYSFY